MPTATEPSITPAQVTKALTDTAQQTPSGSYDVLTGFGIVDADGALAKAGQLMKERAEGSQVSLSSHFGGGPAAVSAAPVKPRGHGWLMAFVVVALVSLAALAGGVIGLARTRERGRSRHAA